MSDFYTEADYEKSVIELFQNMDYRYVYAPDLERDFRSPLYEEEVDESIRRINPDMPEDAIADALYKLKNFENAELVLKNALFMDYIQHGIEVRYFVKGEERSGLVYLVDYKNPDNNSFVVANQWTFIENSNKRPDILLFLNGMPVVLIELKSPSREETDASEAYTQIRNYMHEIPSMFIYNCICVMSDHLTSTARIIRNTLPNATYIGFTGTPISMKDRNTREVFGDYIDIYDMTQAVEDGATRPVYYESRVIKLKLDEHTLKLIDQEYDIMANNAAPEVIEKSKKQLGQMEEILGNDKTIASLVDDILDHYENYRENLLTGKAMIVAYSRPIAMKIYERILQLRPSWIEKIAVVMTGSNKDPEEWNKIIGNKRHKDELAKQFKDNDSPLKIAIVVDMWLTGFDVPSLATMYIYKPMQGCNLMQAIARVNRVFGDKEGGLVVDYVGIAAALKQAMNDYTARDKKNYGDTDVAKVAYPKFLEKLSVCRDLFYGYDYSKFMNGTDLERSKAISGAVNFIVAVDKADDREVFLKEGLLLKQALSLCASLAERDLRVEAAFFESVRVLVIRLMNQGEGKKISLPEMNARINNLLKASVQSDGVINLFSDIDKEFSLFDPKFLAEVSKMKEKNLAVELLKKLIAEQVKIYRHTNVVKSEKFSEIIQRTMNAYLNGMLTNEQVIEELLNLAKQIAAAHKEGDQLGLTADELAFYDALTKPQAIKDFYENEELIAITKELADTLRKNRTIDWQKRDSARARMRMMIKRLLKKHRYPPEGMEDAVRTVMTQCELWTDNNDMELLHEKSNVYTYLPQPELSKVAEDSIPYGN